MKLSKAQITAIVESLEKDVDKINSENKKKILEEFELTEDQQNLYNELVTIEESIKSFNSKNKENFIDATIKIFDRKKFIYYGDSKGYLTTLKNHHVRNNYKPIMKHEIKHLVVLASIECSGLKSIIHRVKNQLNIL